MNEKLATTSKFDLTRFSNSGIPDTVQISLNRYILLFSVLEKLLNVISFFLSKIHCCCFPNFFSRRCLLLVVMERGTEEKRIERFETIRSQFRLAVVCTRAIVY